MVQLGHWRLLLHDSRFANNFDSVQLHVCRHLQRRRTPGPMARSSNGRRNPIRSCRRRLDTIDEDAWGPWANLPVDILMVIIMKLGLIVFLAFSGVCTPWRSSALSNRSTFLARKEPLLLTLSKNACTKNVCIFIDIFDESRRYKTALGSDPSRRFSVVGVSCGYLIICRNKSSELYLINPITRHELYFPPLPKNSPFYYASFRSFLVYSSSLSKFIVVILYRGNNRGDNHNLVIFSGSGDSEWVFLPNPGQDWVDLAFFKGKVYMLNRDGSIGEMRMNPWPSLHLLYVKKIPSLERELISSGERLFMVEHLSRTIVKYEFDFEKMEWVVIENLGGDSLFINRVKSSAIVSCSNWLGRGKAQCNGTYRLPKICGVEADLWYFPHDCCSNNLLEDS